ncbi:hypothetical protein ACOSP7_020422 [Xanthoceras sorbifolium]|uniref:GATA transcription factor n=1 Tax=Xanthoceras sorbifolium TaxID=99658 RepID=A0ABQ8HLT8_9ROSI|nr:hypothetical protein JRO89_XS09G0181200 [Xanthoceras sorbifolium]
METPEYFIGGYFNNATSAADFMAEKRAVSDQKPGENFNFTIEDLLDFSNEDAIVAANGGFLDNATGNSTDSSTVTCNSAGSGGENNFSGNAGGGRNRNSFADSQFSGELCVPYDDLAELEWLSNFVEDSFSIDQTLQKKHLNILSGSKPPTPESSSSSTQPEPASPKPSNSGFLPETPLPGKARSKRSRAAPCNWATRLLHVSPKAPSIKREDSSIGSRMDSGSIRKCLHCATEKTPQWRTGPMGPKTLCNACGVRYKSGRLVAEYRPAASPTFMSTRHSNSHRKVLELRRQKEMQRAHQQQFLSQSSIFGISNGGDEYLIHHHTTGPDFRHMM